MSVSGYTWVLTPRRSKQRCCIAVGSLGMVNVAPLCTIRTRFAVSVPNSLIRPRKLCTGRPSSVRLLAAFRCAAGDRCAGCTTDSRRCSPAARSWSSNSTGASFLRMCHST